ncbi:MAG: anti-sigma factor [Gammaproteobacteria bacterium]|nr:anti-sigma factor [Gammaproteobacteria bacterium]
MNNDNKPHDDNLLAGEYVIGVLPFGERMEFKARLSEEPALRKQVHDWEARLSVLDEQTPPVTAPEGLYADIERRLFGKDPKPDQNVWRWLRAASFAGLIGLALFGTLQLQKQEQALPKMYATTLQPTETSELQVVAVYDSAQGSLRLNRTAGAPEPDRVFELWLIPAGNAPVSLGLLPQQSTAEIALPESLRAVVDGATLAVSDEPPGGSPTGAPTGAVLSAGQLILL